MELLPIMVPSRNKIVFTGKPTENTIELCNETLQHYLRNNIFDQDTIYTIHSINNTIYQQNNQEQNDYDVCETICGINIIRNINSLRGFFNNF